MKRQLFLILIISNSFIAFSQHAPTGLSTVPFTGNPLQPTYLSSMVSQPLKLEEMNIIGSPYLSMDFKPALVRVQNGYSQANVPVRFNLFANEMEFKIGDNIKVLDSLSSVLYFEKANDSSSVRFFKAGYPPLSKTNKNTIYEVIVIRKNIHLLKHSFQKIEARRSMGLPDEKVLVTYSELYLFDTKNNTISKVKNILPQLEEILNIPANIIKSLAVKNSLNVNKEKDLGELITLLDR